jgi:hypothetical protein
MQSCIIKKDDNLLSGLLHFFGLTAKLGRGFQQELLDNTGINGTFDNFACDDSVCCDCRKQRQRKDFLLDDCLTLV